MRMSVPYDTANSGGLSSASTKSTIQHTVKERKVSQSASCKIDNIIRQLFLPMLGMPTPERTSFLEEDAGDQMMRQVAQEHPGALATESDFVDYMVLLYRKFQLESGRLNHEAAHKGCVAAPLASSLDSGLESGLESGLDSGLKSGLESGLNSNLDPGVTSDSASG